MDGYEFCVKRVSHTDYLLGKVSYVYNLIFSTDAKGETKRERKKKKRKKISASF